jgi:protein SCO1/2
MTAAAAASLSRADLAGVEAAPQSDAVLPLTLPLQGDEGNAKPLQYWLGSGPSVWILADFTCETLCGPVVSIVSEALAHSGLKPGPDFRLIVVGLDPKDTAADAAAMKTAQIGTAGELPAHTFFLRGSAKDLADLTTVFGFRSVYDRAHDQFAHPAAAFVVTPDGRIARTLPGLAMDPASLRLALVGASQGRIGSWKDHVRLMCYGFDPASGVYTAAVGRMLAGAGVATIIALVLLISILFRRERAIQAQ